METFAQSGRTPVSRTDGVRPEEMDTIQARTLLSSSQFRRFLVLALISLFTGWSAAPQASGNDLDSQAEQLIDEVLAELDSAREEPLTETPLIFFDLGARPCINDQGAEIPRKELGFCEENPFVFGRRCLLANGLRDAICATKNQKHRERLLSHFITLRKVILEDLSRLHGGSDPFPEAPKGGRKTEQGKNELTFNTGHALSWRLSFICDDVEASLVPVLREENLYSDYEAMKCKAESCTKKILHGFKEPVDRFSRYDDNSWTFVTCALAYQDFVTTYPEVNNRSFEFRKSDFEFSKLKNRHPGDDVKNPLSIKYPADPMRDEKHLDAFAAFLPLDLAGTTRIQIESSVTRILGTASTPDTFKQNQRWLFPVFAANGLGCLPRLDTTVADQFANSVLKPLKGTASWIRKPDHVGEHRASEYLSALLTVSSKVLQRRQLEIRTSIDSSKQAILVSTSRPIPSTSKARLGFEGQTFTESTECIVPDIPAQSGMSPSDTVEYSFEIPNELFWDSGNSGTKFVLWLCDDIGLMLAGPIAIQWPSNGTL